MARAGSASVSLFWSEKWFRQINQIYLRNIQKAQIPDVGYCCYAESSLRDGISGSHLVETSPEWAHPSFEGAGL